MPRLFFLFLSFLIPPTCLYWGTLPYSYRYHSLIFLSFLMVVYAALYQKFTWQDLGFRYDTLPKSLFWNGLWAISIVIFVLSANHFGKIRNLEPPNWSYFFIFYVFVSSPMQEFLYRSIIFAELKYNSIQNKWLIIGISALNFSYLHIFYHDFITLIVSFMMGVVWGSIYFKYPNFWGVALSHAVIGAVSIFVGLI